MQKEISVRQVVCETRWSWIAIWVGTRRCLTWTSMLDESVWWLETVSSLLGYASKWCEGKGCLCHDAGFFRLIGLP